MGIAAPLALIGLLAVPLIVAFYMLRLRRDERPVTSTYLWQQLVRDVAANAPWQRLRRSLLLLLQLLLAALLAIIVAQPFSERPARLSRDLVLVIDASPSMGAQDVFPDRLAAAKRAAIDALAQVPSDGRVSVVAATETARVVANEASDRARLTRAIDSVELSTAPGNLADALALAGKLAERARGAEILVLTDDAGSTAVETRVSVPVRVVTVGRERDNQGILALAVRSDATGLQRVVFASVANFSNAEVPRRLQILADGTPVSARDLVLGPLTRTEVVIDEIPSGSQVVEARLTDADEAGASASPDHLAVDDAAWAVVPPDRLRRVLLVGPGNVYLQNAFALLPNVELYGATPSEYATTTGRELFDLIVFDGYLPPELPAKPILAFAPPRTSALGDVGGAVSNPAVSDAPADESLLRNVDLSRLHVASAQRVEPPSWARVVLPGSPSPLIYAGSRDGQPAIVFAFDLRQSDLPLQVAWPILVSNLAGELLGLDPAALDPVVPASPVTLQLGPDAVAARVTLPDGSVVEVPRTATGATSVTFTATRQLGVYRAEAVLDPAAVETRGARSPSAEPSLLATGSPPPSTSPAASPSPGSGLTPPGSADEAYLFAVDLFSEDESAIAPGDGSRIAALGSEAAPNGEAASGVARDDWWPPLVLLALLVLSVEWIVYERDGARRIVGSLGTRFAAVRARAARLRRRSQRAA